MIRDTLFLGRADVHRLLTMEALGGHTARRARAHQPIGRDELTEKQIAGTLGAVVAGSLTGREDPAGITVFDSTGLAVQDMAVARALYDSALKKGVGTNLALAREQATPD